MDVTTALLRIKRQFGDEYDTIITNDDIYGWIYEAELDIIRSTGCNDNVVTTTVSAFPVSVPDIVNIKRVTVAGKALTPITKEELDLVGLSDTLTSTPEYWYKEDQNIHLYPQNIADTTAVKIEYSKIPTLMSGDPTLATFTIPDVWRPDLVRFCIARAHNKNQRTELENIEMAAYERNVGKRSVENNTPDVPLYKGIDPLDFNEYDYYYG